MREGPYNCSLLTDTLCSLKIDSSATSHPLFSEHMVVFKPLAVRTSWLKAGAALEGRGKACFLILPGLAVPIQQLTDHVVAIPPAGCRCKHVTSKGSLSCFLSTPLLWSLLHCHKGGEQLESSKCLKCRIECTMYGMWWPTPAIPALWREGQEFKTSLTNRHL